MELREDQGTTTVRPTALEKAVISFVLAVVIGLLSWVSYTLLNTSQQIAVINTKLDYLSEASKTSYSAADAAADQRNIDRRFAEFDRRVTALETDRTR